MNHQLYTIIYQRTGGVQKQVNLQTRELRNIPQRKRFIYVFKTVLLLFFLIVPECEKQEAVGRRVDKGFLY